jgi:hypothetical protein
VTGPGTMNVKVFTRIRHANHVRDVQTVVRGLLFGTNLSDGDSDNCKLVKLKFS